MVHNVLFRVAANKGVGLSFNPSDHGLIVVYDIHKRAYRMINLNTIVLTNVGLC